MLEYDAYAKVNLVLELPNVKRDDGYHEISTIMQTVSLCDHIRFEKASDIEISSNMLEWDAEYSLVSKALVLMQNEIATSDGVHIHITKNIPLSSGLGGDSSDAATVLVGLNELWEGHLGVTELKMLAEKLGSDVPFFVEGGTQHAKGRGEKLTNLPTPRDLKLILCTPNVAIPNNKTKLLYGAIEDIDLTDCEIVSDVSWKIQTSESLSSFDLYNAFDRVTDSIFDGLKEIKNTFESISNTRVIVSGAGPSIFTIVDSDDERYRVYNGLTNLGYQAWIVDCVERRNIPVIIEESSDF